MRLLFICILICFNKTPIAAQEKVTTNINHTLSTSEKIVFIFYDTFIVQALNHLTTFRFGWSAHFQANKVITSNFGIDKWCNGKYNQFEAGTWQPGSNIASLWYEEAKERNFLFKLNNITGIHTRTCVVSTKPYTIEALKILNPKENPNNVRYAMACTKS